MGQVVGHAVAAAGVADLAGSTARVAHQFGHRAEGRRGRATSTMPTLARCATGVKSAGL